MENTRQISGFLSNWEPGDRKEPLWDTLESIRRGSEACLWSTDVSAQLKTHTHTCALIWDHASRRAVEWERVFKVTAVNHVILEYRSEHLLLLSSAKWVTYIDEVTTKKTYLEHLDIFEKERKTSQHWWMRSGKPFSVSSSVPVSDLRSSATDGERWAYEDRSVHLKSTKQYSTYT